MPIRAGWPRPFREVGIMSKRGAPVVIMRKDKRIRHKLLHAAAFAATGGASGIVTAAEAANHAGYNVRTRKLQAEAGEPDETETGASEVQQAAAAAKARQPVGLRGMMAQIDVMNAEELRELVMMSDGRAYSYWRHGSGITAQQRVIFRMASRRLSKLERPA